MASTIKVSELECCFFLLVCLFLNFRVTLRKFCGQLSWFFIALYRKQINGVRVTPFCHAGVTRFTFHCLVNFLFPTSAICRVSAFLIVIAKKGNFTRFIRTKRKMMNKQESLLLWMR